MHCNATYLVNLLLGAPHGIEPPHDEREGHHQDRETPHAAGLRAVEVHPEQRRALCVEDVLYQVGCLNYWAVTVPGGSLSQSSAVP